VAHGPALSITPEKAFGCAPIAPWLNEDVDHVTVLVDGPPQILQATVDVHEQFVQVPRVAQGSLPLPQDTSVRRTELLTPLPNRLVGHSDAPLSEEIFGIAEAQTETVVQPDGMTDDFRRESVATVAGGRSSSAYSASTCLNLTVQQTVIRLDHGAGAIALPLRLAANEWTPILVYEIEI